MGDTRSDSKRFESGVELRQLDDVTWMQFADGPSLLIACDSLGAIGPKKYDQVKVLPHVVGRFACRVPLMEVMALGGDPVLVVDNLCTELESVGEEIIAGIRVEMREAGLDPVRQLTGSSEKNVPTLQTALGVTVIARLSQNGRQATAYRHVGQTIRRCQGPAKPRWGLVRPGDLALVVGRPKVGAEVRLDDPEILDLPCLKRILAFTGTRDVIPVGSTGIAVEADKLAARAGLVCELAGGVSVDTAKSAGPSTCAVVAIAPETWKDFTDCVESAGKPVSYLGWFVLPVNE